MGILLGNSSRRWFWTLAAIGFVLVVCLGRCALASECLSKHSVRSANPDAHLSYSGRVDGHKGARCWYADVGYTSPRAVAQSRHPRTPPARHGRTAGLIPATGATAIAYAEREVVLPVGLDQWIASIIGSEPIASFGYRFDAVYGQ